MRHPLLGALGALDLHDLYVLKGQAAEWYAAAHRLEWTAAMVAWWAGAGMLANDAERLLLSPALPLADLTMLTLQLETARDQAAKAGQPKLADLWADALNMVYDEREGAADATP